MYIFISGIIILHSVYKLQNINTSSDRHYNALMGGELRDYLSGFIITPVYQPECSSDPWR